MASGGKAPLSVTEMPAETLVELNRGRLRGWIFLGGVVFAVLAVLSWPLLPYVLICVSIAVSLVAVGVWIQVSTRDVETED